jgi:hypothetical protein
LTCQKPQICGFSPWLEVIHLFGQLDRARQMAAGQFRPALFSGRDGVFQDACQGYGLGLLAGIDQGAGTA